MRKESSVGARVTYAYVCKQDQKAKAKMRWEFQKTFGDPKRALSTLSYEKSKEQAGNGRAAFSNDAVSMTNAYFLPLSFLSRMIFELKQSRVCRESKPKASQESPRC